MRIFILGAGYVGRAIIENWRRPEDHFWASTTTESKLPSLQRLVEKAFVLKGNEEQQLLSILPECDGMIICAAPRHKDQYDETYRQTAKSVVKALEGRTAPFYLLYTGSTSVYGDHHGEGVNETSSLNASSEKAQILKETEALYLSLPVTTCILRLGGIYGPSRELETRAQKISGQKIPGDENCPTNHIHLSDIVNAAQFCFEKRLKGIYNLVNNAHPSRKELYTAICDRLNIPPPLWDRSTPSIHGSNCIISNRKILTEGFVLSHPSIIHPDIQV